MLRSKVLSQKSIHTCRFPLEDSLINLDMVKFIAMKNYWEGFRKTENKNDFRYNYYNASDDKNISWLIDYIRDTWALEKKKQSINYSKGFLVQGREEFIPLHNEVIENDILNSPDISVLYTVDCGEIPVNVVFQHKKKGVLTEKIRIPIMKNNYIIYSSELDHNIEINTNREPLINLHFSFNEK